MGLGRDSACALRVPQDQVGIGANLQRALARVEIEDLRGVGAGQRDEVSHRQLAAVDAFIPEHRHTVLDACRAIGDLAEVIAPCGFLLGAKAAVVGGGGVQVARLQATPQRLLMPTRAKRRAHYVAGGGLPVGVAIHAVVQQQMAGQHLAVHRLTLGAGIGDFVQGFLGRDVHQIQRRAQRLGDADGTAGGFAFDLGRPRQRVRFRPG